MWNKSARVATPWAKTLQVAGFTTIGCLAKVLGILPRTICYLD
jgi:hypothetical protein